MKIWTKLGLLTLVGLSLTSCGSNTKNTKGQSSSSQKVETSAGASKSNIYADPSTLSDKYDVIIVGSGGAGMTAAIEAKDILANEGINAKVINIHTIKPLDNELIVKSAKETGAIVTAEEHSIIGGLGSAVAEAVTTEYPIPVLRVGIKDVFGESGKPEELLKAYNLTSQDIVNKVKQAITLKK